MESKFITKEKSKIFLNGYKTVITKGKKGSGLLFHVYDSGNNIIEVVEEENTYCTIYGGCSRGDVDSITVLIDTIELNGYLYCGCRFGNAKSVNITITNSKINYVCAGCETGDIYGYTHINIDKSTVTRIDPKSKSKGTVNTTHLDIVDSSIAAIDNSDHHDYYKVYSIRNLEIKLIRSKITERIELDESTAIDTLNVDISNNSFISNMSTHRIYNNATINIKDSEVDKVLRVTGNVTIDSSKVAKLYAANNSNCNIINHSNIIFVIFNIVRNAKLFVSTDSMIYEVRLYRDINNIDICYKSAKNYQIKIEPELTYENGNTCYYAYYNMGNVTINTDAKINVKSIEECIVNIFGHLNIKGKGRLVSKTEKLIEDDKNRFRYKVFTISDGGKITFEDKNVKDITENGTYVYRNCKWEKVKTLRKLKPKTDSNDKTEAKTTTKTDSKKRRTKKTSSK